MWGRIINKLNWKFLSTISQHNFVNNILVWLVIVPIVAKLFSLFEDTVSLTYNNQVYVISLELPFSWTYLYFSALLFLIGNILYKTNVPSIIDENETFSDFLKAGKGKHELSKYVEEESLSEDYFYELIDDNVLDEDVKYDYFGEILIRTNNLHVKRRLLIFSIYAIAIILLIIVFIENLLFVIEQI